MGMEHHIYHLRFSHFENRTQRAKKTTVSVNHQKVIIAFFKVQY